VSRCKLNIIQAITQYRVYVI